MLVLGDSGPAGSPGPPGPPGITFTTEDGDLVPGFGAGEIARAWSISSHHPPPFPLLTYESERNLSSVISGRVLCLRSLCLPQSGG
ncbi:unnamed protein product [Nezara viridula]|uniref:Uncharacterized protein n=1 Tax=Nezara viridula TaxID=85310 RepID=A0A9P0HAE0_NEZVI|nr:unnamed protein product [Nezara viridula]